MSYVAISLSLVTDGQPVIGIVDAPFVGERFVAPVVVHAHRLVEEGGMQPLPLGITPHNLRHTFASILVAIGKDPTYVMQQLGHTDPAFTLRVYAHAMRRSEQEREQLKALVEDHDWAQIGHKTAESTSASVERNTD